MGARFEALIEGVLMTPLDFKYTQVGFNLISVQVCSGLAGIFIPRFLSPWRIFSSSMGRRGPGGILDEAQSSDRPRGPRGRSQGHRRQGFSYFTLRVVVRVSCGDFL